MGGGGRGRGQRHGTFLEVTDIHAHGLGSTWVYIYARTFQMVHFKNSLFYVSYTSMKTINLKEMSSGLSLSGVITDDLYFLLYAFLRFPQVKSIISKIFSLYSVQTFS